MLAAYAWMDTETLGGASTVKALQKLYGKTVGQFRGELNNYFSASLFKAYVFPFSLEAQTAPPDIRPATGLRQASSSWRRNNSGRWRARHSRNRPPMPGGADHRCLWSAQPTQATKNDRLRHQG